MDKQKLKQISPVIWEIPQESRFGMRVPGRILAIEELVDGMDEGVFEQVKNTATLPGLVDYVLAMPDAHWGYGAPIGAFFATDPKKGGIISPGCVGFDINCGVRLLTTPLTFEEVQPKLEKLLGELFERVPSGVGAKGYFRLNRNELEGLMREGARFLIEKGYGFANDEERAEESGVIPGALPEKVSEKAIERGIDQIGTLGSGNHYLEIQVVRRENIFDRELAEKFGIFPGQVTVMIHCGSRGFGHQVATDYLRLFERAMVKFGIHVPDWQLACAPFESGEGQAYFGAMIAAANTAFANRQMITHRVRESLAEVFGVEPGKIELVYDVAHNIAKLEEYGGKRLLVHRKGATRAFGPGNVHLSRFFKKTGQPVILGGSMETGSYLLVGTHQAEESTFGSTAHGSGRTMSRIKAKKLISGKKLQEEMARRGILVKTGALGALSEEAGSAYKEISQVVESLEKLGISRKVMACSPIGNIKG